MIYRWFTILAHKFNWHHAPVIGPICDNQRPYERWCKWCGFRETYRYDPRTPNAAIAEHMEMRSRGEV